MGEASAVISGQGRPRIRALPPLVASQIAAGEVVERPASVVKELVENALDAGASRVTIELEQGGVELIRVTDDGAGMPPDDLPLALAPHATSKVRTSEDLIRIATMGFRGEALASIASVSRLSIRSRTADSQGASLIEAEGDRSGPVQPASGPIGTAVTVRNLFFNTPARRKFLRTERTEQGRCAEVIDQIAMARPGIGFKLICDGRVSLEVEPQGPRDRIAAILGEELSSQLLEAHADEIDASGPGSSRGLSLYGLVGLPSIARATAQAQHLFVNGRPVKDRTIMHALREAYRGIIEPSRYPTAVLLIEMDPAMVDVNVHPAKSEVRFRDSSLVHSAVLRAVRDALRAADLTPTIGAARPWQGEGRAILPATGYGSAGGGGGGGSPFVEYFRRAAPGNSPTRLSYDALRDALHPPIDTNAEIAESKAAETAERAPWSSDSASGGAFSAPSASPSASSALPTPEPASPILQVHKSYLVTQDSQGVLIIDQHALHERAMFELLLARIASADLESQHLLVPAVVEASPAHIDRLPLLVPLLKRLGIDAEALGPTQIAIHAFPTFLFDKGVEPGPLVAELLEKSAADGFEPDREETLRDVLDMMSCKAAIKAGDQMSTVELAELVRLREAIERSSNCPHGRPTSIRVTIRDLEKLFGRA
jgi:DNA mismatch repair protein MutL